MPKREILKNDGLVKSQKTPFFVIPAKAGIQSFTALASPWTPVFTGVTTFCESVKNDLGYPRKTLPSGMLVKFFIGGSGYMAAEGKGAI